MGARQLTREVHRTVRGAELIAAVCTLRLSSRRSATPAGRTVLERAAEILGERLGAGSS